MSNKSILVESLKNTLFLTSRRDLLENNLYVLYLYGSYKNCPCKVSILLVVTVILVYKKSVGYVVYMLLLIRNN